LLTSFPGDVIASDVIIDTVVPTIKAALASIASHLDSTVHTIVPAVTGTVIPLVVSEVETLISVLGEVQNIVSDIEGALLSLVSTIGEGKCSSFPQLIPRLTHF